MLCGLRVLPCAGRLEEESRFGKTQTDVTSEVGVSEPGGFEAFLGPRAQERRNDENGPIRRGPPRRRQVVHVLGFKTRLGLDQYGAGILGWAGEILNSASPTAR